jgi:receptor expression-enhancing protein 1/2/3/4
MLWDQVAVAMGQAPSNHASAIGRELEEDERIDSAQPPTLNNPMGGPMQLVSSLWGSYGPSILAGGMALVGAARNAQSESSSSRRPGASVLTTPPSSRIRSHTRKTTTAGRNRQFETELRELNNDENVVPVSSIEGLPGGSGTTSRSSSDSIVHRVRQRDHVRSRSASGGSGRFEEVEVPSDVEGYDVADHEPQAAHNTAAAGTGGGWFGGWGSNTSSNERVKRD